MALRLGDWKGRAVVAAVVAAGFLLTGAGIALVERSLERRQLQQQAWTLVELNTGPIAVSYQNFFESGFYKFRQLIMERMRVQPRLARVRIVDMSGRVRFDSDDMDKAQVSGPQQPLLVSERTREAVVLLERTALPPPHGERDALEMVDPYLEEWGRHEISIIYSFDLRPELDRATRFHLGTCLVLSLAGAAVTIAALLALLRRVA